MYRLVFWQNCLSPHQMPYISHLLDDERVNEVIIVIDELVTKDRKEMGWDVSSFSNLENYKIITSPSHSEIKNIFSIRQSDSIHFFSGINGYSFIKKVLEISLHFNIKRGIITERPFTYKFGLANGKPLWMHKIRFHLHDKPYARHIQYVFAMGEDAVNYFEHVYRNWKVFPFIYCTDNKKHLITSITEHNSKPINIVFVGSLIRRKNPQIILQALNKISTNKIHITFIGDGPEKKYMMKYMQKHNLNNIDFKGFLSNNDIPDFLYKQDILILPSIHDGWGAVVNEGLTEGLFIICSDHVGAKDLLSENWRGEVFKNKDIHSLTKILKKCIKNIDTIRESKIKRMYWSRKYIAGDIISKYFIDCIDKGEASKPWCEIIQQI